MGLFSKILPALEVVGGIAMEFVPGMQLAGAMLITQGVASSGLIGGSVGKFLNSSVAKDLMMAASIGSIADGMYGSFAQNAAAGATDAAAKAGGAATGGAAQVSAVTEANADLVPVGSAASTAVGSSTAP